MESVWACAGMVQAAAINTNIAVRNEFISVGIKSGSRFDVAGPHYFLPPRDITLELIEKTFR